MKSHIVPTKEQQPDVIVLRCGTNDLRKTENVESISSINIMELVLSLGTDSNSVIVSGLTPRNDKFRQKATELRILKAETNSRNIGFVDQSNIDHRHLNRSNLHLNRVGSGIFANNLELAIKKLTGL